MALISLQDIRIGFGGEPVLDGVNLTIETHERICLMGRNGAGKSTLLKLIARELSPDEGNVLCDREVSIARLAQDIPDTVSGRAFDVVASGTSETGRLSQAQVDQVLTRMKLSTELDFESASVGFKRRVLLARALVQNPDVLLLDEPTNHLDLEAIEWMEAFLKRYRGTVVFVSHDRSFMKALATRLVEIDRGLLTSYACNYESYLKRKEAFLETETVQRAQFDKHLAGEEAWIREGIRDRRTRNEGRLRVLMKLREERSARREVSRTVGLQVQSGDCSAKIVIEAENLGFDFGEGPIVQNFSATILRGDKVGVIGQNGAGKSTLLRLLLGDLDPLQGEVKHGVRLQVAYFDQIRAQLNNEKTVMENVADGQEEVNINGKQRHVISYLKDFLFSRERARTKVKVLSGGERNRLLLARLFARPANVLILDEPTNDLDIETLEFLEDYLVRYSGTLLLVSHDRTFLNHVVSSTLVFEGDGHVQEYAGGYDDWLRQRTVKAVSERKPVSRPKVKRVRPDRPRKLNYREREELDALPGEIEGLEAEQAQWHQTLSDPAFYQQDGNRVAETKSRLQLLENSLKKAYCRWESLEAIREGLNRQ